MDSDGSAIFAVLFVRSRSPQKDNAFPAILAENDNALSPMHCCLYHRTIDVYSVTREDSIQQMQ
jgi:hypothetical protein